jgi:hypothetical protein
MLCSKCHSPNPEGSKFCESCGSSLAPPAPIAQAKPAVRHCGSCGATLKPGAKFCAGCGAAVSGAVATMTAPRPAPPTPTRLAPPPPSASVHFAPQPPAYAPRAGAPSGGNKGRFVLGFVLLVLVLGGYWAYSTILLSRPQAFAGTWEMTTGKNTLGGDKFKLQQVEGGVKLVPPDGSAAPMEIVMKPAGTRKVAATLTNPQDASQKVEISAELNGFGNELTLTAKLPNGQTEQAKAKRTAGP